MTSRGIIILICIALAVIDWTTAVFTNSFIPISFALAFVIMDLAGMFKKELVAREKGRKEPEELSNRQKDFLSKLEEGKLDIPAFEDEDLQARIVTVDEKGNQSIVIIKADGSIETEGKADVDVIEAVTMLRDSIEKYGIESVAEELGEQIAKIKNRRNGQ